MGMRQLSTITTGRSGPIITWEVCACAWHGRLGSLLSMSADIYNIPRSRAQLPATSKAASAAEEARILIKNEQQKEKQHPEKGSLPMTIQHQRPVILVIKPLWLTLLRVKFSV